MAQLEVWEEHKEAHGEMQKSVGGFPFRILDYDWTIHTQSEFRNSFQKAAAMELKIEAERTCHGTIELWSFNSVKVSKHTEAVNNTSGVFLRPGG